MSVESASRSCGFRERRSRERSKPVSGRAGPALSEWRVTGPKRAANISRGWSTRTGPRERRHTGSLADNRSVPYIPVGLIHQGALREMVDRARSALGPEVWNVAYRLAEDNTGTPSIFFRITMQDFAMTESAISDSTGRVATVLFDEVRPLENWGLRPYFNFRSVSEQKARPEPDWV